jgi:mersacidin/lichenicidin family type 2 lantibiotic
VKEIAMSSEKIIRAWKDLEYRLSLSAAERAQLPDHPAGLVALTEKELSPVDGGTAPTWGCGAHNYATIQWSLCHVLLV